MKNSTEAQSIVCEPGDRASAEIRRTELKLGEFSYQLQPDGRDAAQMTITSASLAAEGGTAQTLAVPDGSTVLRIPDGAASIKYTLTVQARYQKSDGSLKNLTFTYVLRYSGDVSLELRYTLLNRTQTAIRCANGQNKTAQTVYSDEVTDGRSCLYAGADRRRRGQRRRDQRRFLLSVRQRQDKGARLRRIRPDRASGQRGRQRGREYLHHNGKIRGRRTVYLQNQRPL